MDLEGTLLSETSRRKTNTTRSHLCVESKTKEQETVPLPPKNKFIDTSNGLVVVGGRGVGDGRNSEFFWGKL